MDKHSHAGARQSDPKSSHDAADRIHETATEKITHDAMLEMGGWVTSWEVTRFLKALNPGYIWTVSPRFRPLLDKELIVGPVMKYAYNSNGNLRWLQAWLAVEDPQENPFGDPAEPCACGSGLLDWFAIQSDGVTINYLCDKCEKKQRANYLPDVKEQPVTAHSSILGGSNADRLLRCPSSYQLSLKAPVEDVASPYADQGTRCHHGIAHCVVNKITAKRLRDGFDWDFFDYPISAEENEYIAVALDALEELKTRYGGKFRVVSMEKWLPLPGITGAGGTADLILANAEFVMLIDWKFGGGVMVPILKDEDDGTQSLLAQAAFYLCCARAAYPRRFKGREIVGAIIQPRAEQPLSYTQTDDDELDGFLEAFKFAYEQAIGRNPPIERGDHCKFARCKTVCPLWTGPVFDLAVIDPLAAQLQASQSAVVELGYGAFLSSALELAAIAEEWAGEVRRQAHVYLENGGAVPGWKLVPKRGTRQWRDDTELVTRGALTDLGAQPEDFLTKPELKSVAQTEKALKARRIALPDDLWHMVSTGTTIAPAEDKRPAAGGPELITNLQEALNQL